MSILIKGMEMPTSCEMCPLGAEVDTVYETAMGCRINFKMRSKGNYDNRPEWCSLVPVPPHGRLIDADSLMFEDDYYGWRDKKVVKAAPTIIPASEDVKTEEDSEPWLCLSCRHYPPSSTDGKPCTQCNPSEVWHSCYDPAEEG